MRVYYSDELYKCTSAVKNGKNAILYLEDGGIVDFFGVKNWDIFTLDGGDWGEPSITLEERLRADVDFIAAMTGVSL